MFPRKTSTEPIGSIFEVSMTYARLTAATLLAVAFLSPSASAAQISIKIPAELTQACDLTRAPIVATTIAQNPEVYPESAVRVAGGWLVYDRYERQVLELDDNLVEVARWGRHGPGPMEYERPIGMARTSSGQVVVIDRDPPSLMLLNEAPTEHALALPDAPIHALVKGDDVLLAARSGSVYQVPIRDPRNHRELWSAADFDITRTPKGALPIMLLRAGPGGSSYVGFKGPSTIWALSETPRKVVQRCVPERLARVHEEAPRVEFPPYGSRVYTVETLQDFLVLASGQILAFGGLLVEGDEGARSIELYSSGGELVRAWRLARPEAKGVFDPTNPRRLLIWRQEESVQLIEVAGVQYPSS